MNIIEWICDNLYLVVLNIWIYIILILLIISYYYTP